MIENQRQQSNKTLNLRSSQINENEAYYKVARGNEKRTYLLFA